jgi:putative Mg2+ transporter-C (MgtC) family protein
MEAQEIAVRLGVAMLFGGLIGFERQWRQRMAGLRTNSLVAIGAAGFVVFSMMVSGDNSPTRVAAQVVSGVGFLGAGVILREGINITGLNTAATLWCSAAVGALSGGGLFGESVLLTVAVLAGNTLLRPLINVINRTPIDERRTEATYEVRVTTEAASVVQLRELLVEVLEAANYPVSDVEVEERGEEDVELVATLVSTAIEPEEIEAVIAKLKKHEAVKQASWTVRTTD